MSDVAFLFCYAKFGLHKKLKLNHLILNVGLEQLNSITHSTNLAGLEYPQ